VKNDLEKILEETICKVLKETLAELKLEYILLNAPYVDETQQRERDKKIIFIRSYG